MIWEYIMRHVSFEWRTKRDAMRIELHDEGYLATFPPTLPSVLDESEGSRAVLALSWGYSPLPRSG